MRRFLTRAALVPSVALLGYACTDRAPTDPRRAAPASAALTAQELRSGILVELGWLFPTGLQGAARSAFDNADADRAAGDAAAAKRKGLQLVDFAARRLKTGQLLDPNGAAAPSTVQSLSTLITLLNEYFGLGLTREKIRQLTGGSVYLAVIDGQAGGEIRNDDVEPGPDRFLVKVPAGAYTGTLLWSVEVRPGSSDILPGVPGASQYPTFVDITTTPAVASTLEPVVIGLCYREPGDADAPPVPGRARVGHGVGTQTELLPVVGVFDLACPGQVPPTGAVDFGASRAGRLLARALTAARRAATVPRAHALHGGLGGATNTVSPFGIVDPGAGAAVALLVAPGGASTVAQGGTLQLSATAVDDALKPVASQPPVTWTSLDPAVATVSATGLVSVNATAAVGTTVFVRASTGRLVAFKQIGVSAPSLVTITGTVVGAPSGAAVAGAEVRVLSAYGPSTTTDANGSYSLGLGAAQAGEAVTLRFSAPGFRTRDVPVRLPPSGSIGVSTTLVPTGWVEVTGVVQGPSGEPFAGATVTVRATAQSGAAATAASAAGGVFTLYVSSAAAEQWGLPTAIVWAEATGLFGVATPNPAFPGDGYVSAGTISLASIIE